MNNIDVAGVKQWQLKGQAFTLVDVREAHERELRSLGGLHIPLGELHLRWREIPEGAPVVFYCAKGIRSGIACQRLEGLEKFELYNLTGGLAAIPDGSAI